MTVSPSAAIWSTSDRTQHDQGLRHTGWSPFVMLHVSVACAALTTDRRQSDMPVPEDRKDAAAYHTIMAEMHRLQAVMISLASVVEDERAEALREHFGREQRLTMGKLTEWRGRRPQIYAEASRDFAGLMERPARSDATE